MRSARVSTQELLWLDESVCLVVRSDEGPQAPP